MSAILASLGLSYVGFAAISLAMTRHHREVTGRACPQSLAVLLRSFGAGLVLASFALVSGHFGIPIGLVAGFGIVSVSATLIAMTLAIAGLARLPRR